MLAPRIRFRLLSAALLLPLTAAGCAQVSGSGGQGVDTLRGQLTLPEAATLPPTARGEVRLVDLRRSEPGRPFLVASQVLDGPLTEPLTYRLQWRPGTMDGGGDYALSGRVFTEARTLYASDSPVPVPAGAGDRRVPVQLAAVPAPAEGEERQRYSLESMPDVQALRDMPPGEMPSLRGDDLYGDYGLTNDPLPSDLIDGDRVILPAE